MAPGHTAEGAASGTFAARPQRCRCKRAFSAVAPFLKGENKLTLLSPRVVLVGAFVMG